MAYYSVKVYKETYDIEASFPAEASRKGRDRWRDAHKQQDKNEFFRIPEPKLVVATLKGTGIPVT